MTFDDGGGGGAAKATAEASSEDTAAAMQGIDRMGSLSWKWIDGEAVITTPELYTGASEVA